MKHWAKNYNGTYLGLITEGSLLSYLVLCSLGKGSITFLVRKKENLNFTLNINANDSFIGMYNIARKNTLGIHLKRFQKEFKKEYNFFPKSMALPNWLLRYKWILQHKNKK